MIIKCRKVLSLLTIGSLKKNKSRFHYMHIQFSPGLEPRAKQTKIIAIQRYMDHHNERNYDEIINAREYLI